MFPGKASQRKQILEQWKHGQSGAKQVKKSKAKLMYDEVLKCFDHGLNYCLLFKQRDTVVWAPEESPLRNVQGSVFWETQPLSWMGLGGRGSFQHRAGLSPRLRGSTLQFHDDLNAFRLGGCEDLWSNPSYTSYTIEGKWNSWLSPCPMPLQGFLLFGECLCNLFQHGLAKSACATDSRLNSTIGGYVCHSWTIEAFRNWSNGFCVPAIHGNAECEIWIDLVNSVIRWIRDDQITLVFSCLEWPGLSLPGIDDASSRPEEPSAPETEVCVTMLPSTQRERPLAHWKHCGPHLIWAWDVYWKYWSNLKSSEVEPIWVVKSLSEYLTIFDLEKGGAVWEAVGEMIRRHAVVS